MLRIIHAADLHLDSAFSSLSAEKAALLRKEQRRIVEDIAARAEEISADLILLAGDLFDSDRFFAETREVLSSAFSGTKARVFIAPGNHDFYSVRSPWERMKMPDNVYVFKSAEPEGIRIPELGCTVWGSAFLSESSSFSLKDFHAEKSGINIMLLHGDTENQGSKYGYISAEDIKASGLDYLALGHIHSFSGVKKSGDTFYAYPGCAIGRGFDECGQKGILSGTVEKGRAELSFVPLSARRYEQLTVDITGSESIEEKIRASMPENCGRDIYRIILTGEHSVQPDTEKLEKELEGCCLKIEIRDKSIPEAGLWSEAGGDSLKGIFLMKLKEKYDSSQDEAEKAKLLKAARYGLNALENREGA